MRVVVRRDGSGDLVFGRKPTSVEGITERVGFPGVENVREVESFVRSTLRPSDPLEAAGLMLGASWVVAVVGLHLINFI